MPQSFALYIQELMVKMAFYFIGTMAILGISLNIFGILVFSRKTFASMSMSFYCILLACVNNFVIIINVLIFMPLYYGQDSYIWSQASCILMVYLNRVSLHWAAWLDMMVALDRTIHILYSTKPMVRAFLENKKYLAGIVLGILFFILTINWQIFEYNLEQVYENVTNMEYLSFFFNFSINIPWNLNFILSDYFL